MPKINGEVTNLPDSSSVQKQPPQSEPSSGTDAQGADDALEKWITSLSPELQPVARRHGQPLFLYCFNAGMAQYAFGALMPALDRMMFVLKTAGAKATANELIPLMYKHVGVLGNTVEWVCGELATERDWTQAQITECKNDMDRAMALVVASRPVPGKIVLPH